MKNNLVKTVTEFEQIDEKGPGAAILSLESLAEQLTVTVDPWEWEEDGDEHEH